VRAEQEDLRGDAFDPAMQAEGQTGREVDEPLGVRVVHVRQVHDHRRALAEVLADRARLVVRTRVQRGDLVRRLPIVLIATVPGLLVVLA
jgi:hypothetical protein